MNTKDRGRSRKTLTLHDAGGWFLFPIYLGIPFLGVVLDYFWNYLFLFLSLRWLRINVSTKSKFIYCAIVTGGGLLIDWLYIVALGAMGNLREPHWSPRWEAEPIWGFITILVPMTVIVALNYAVSRLYLRVTSRQAMIIGAIMGLFTTPWLIIIYLAFID